MIYFLERSKNIKNRKKMKGKVTEVQSMIKKLKPLLEQIYYIKINQIIIILFNQFKL